MRTVCSLLLSLEDLSGVNFRLSENISYVDLGEYTEKVVESTETWIIDPGLNVRTEL